MTEGYRGPSPSADDVGKESCVCGVTYAEASDVWPFYDQGTVHRIDGPCYSADEPPSAPDVGTDPVATLHNWASTLGLTWSRGFAADVVRVVTGISRAPVADLMERVLDVLDSIATECDEGHVAIKDEIRGEVARWCEGQRSETDEGAHTRRAPKSA